MTESSPFTVGHLVGLESDCSWTEFESSCTKSPSNRVCVAASPGLAGGGRSHSRYEQPSFLRLARGRPASQPGLQGATGHLRNSAAPARPARCCLAWFPCVLPVGISADLNRGLSVPGACLLGAWMIRGAGFQNEPFECPGLAGGFPSRGRPLVPWGLVCRTQELEGPQAEVTLPHVCTRAGTHPTPLNLMSGSRASHYCPRMGSISGGAPLMPFGFCLVCPQRRAAEWVAALVPAPAGPSREVAQ